MASERYKYYNIGVACLLVGAIACGIAAFKRYRDSSQKLQSVKSDLVLAEQAAKSSTSDSTTAASANQHRLPKPMPTPRMIDKLSPPAEDLFPDYPVMRSSFLDAAEARYRLLYAPFISSEHLSSSAVDRFYGILKDGEAAWVERKVEGAQNSSKEKTAELKANGKIATKTQDDGLKMDLGDEVYRKMKTYDDQLSTREGLKRFASMFQYTDNQPSAEQLSQLVSIFSDSGLFTTKKEQLDSQKMDELRVKAQSVITPSQFEALDFILDNRQITKAGIF